jgi:hypothetical protein
MESTYYKLLAPASYGGLSKFKPKGYTKKEVREWLVSGHVHFAISGHFQIGAASDTPTERSWNRAYKQCFKFNNTGILVFPSILKSY